MLYLIWNLFKEKLLVVDVEDKGKDLKDVQELIKRTDSVVEYMGGLEKRIKVGQKANKILFYTWSIY